MQQLQEQKYSFVCLKPQCPDCPRMFQQINDELSMAHNLVSRKIEESEWKRVVLFKILDLGPSEDDPLRLYLDQEKAINDFCSSLKEKLQQFTYSTEKFKKSIMKNFEKIPELKKFIQLMDNTQIDNFNSLLQSARIEADEWYSISRRQIANEQKINTIVSPIQLSASIATEQILYRITNKQFRAEGFNHFGSSFTHQNPILTQQNPKPHSFGYINQEMTKNLFGQPIVFNIFKQPDDFVEVGFIQKVSYRNLEALNTYHPHGFYTFTTNGYVNKEKENFLVGGSKLSGVFITVLVTLKQDMITFSIEEKISENKLVKVVEIPIKKDMELYPCFSASGRPTITFGAV